MADIDNIKFSNLTFTYKSGNVYNIQATFQLFGGLLIAGSNQPSDNEFEVNFENTGADDLNADIIFSAQLDTNPSNVERQNVVDFKFVDLVSGASDSNKAKGKLRSNYCPPPGAPVNQGSTTGILAGYGARIKSLSIDLSNGTSEVTVVTENVSGTGAGYRIVSNTSHMISNGSFQTWAFEIEGGKTVDTNNVFQIDFSNIDPDVGLPILFYPKGSDVNDIDQSDALIWVEQ